ncbi:MAG: GNAT family N-acetyltransferase [Janthinobacterium lividum]
MRHLRHAEINYAQWDAAIEQAANGLVYALSWYLDAASPGWEALVAEAAGEYVAVMPLPVQQKLGLRYLKQPVFAQQFGLFYRPHAAPTAADWQAIGQLLRHHFRFITKYSFNTGNPELLATNALGLPGQPMATYHLALHPPYAALQQGYNQNRRRHLARARQQGLHLEPATDLELLIQLFADNTAGNIYGLLGEGHEYPQLRALYQAAQQAGKASFWQARTAAGAVVAMVLLWQFKGQLVYIFNASTPTGKAEGAVTLLLDEIFQTHAGQPLIFDFEAPPVPSLQQFYRGFGAVPAPFLTITYNGLPWPLKQLNATRIAVQRRLLAYWRRG